MALNALGLGLLFTAKDLASGVMANVRNGFSQTRDELGRFGNRSKESFKQFGMGLAVMGAGLGALAILGSTIDDARDFGKAIDLVRTEVDEAAFSQADMRDLTIDLGKQFGRMPKDEAEALYKAVALGANTAAKATDIMTAANTLAVAGNSDLKTTMDALGGAINAYGLKSSDASMVSDAFFNAMKGGNTTVQDLASSVGRVSAGAHEMGISIQEVLGSVSVMTNKGIQASEAVSYLHGALANIAHPSKDAAAEAARLGIKFDAAAIRSQGFVKFLHSIADNAKFNKDSLNKLFTSVEGSSAMAMLAGDMSAVDASMKSMATGAGATAKGFDIMAQGLSFQTDKMKANFSALKIRIGEFLEPIAAKGLGILNRLMDAFTNLPGPVMDVIIHVALAAASVVTLIGSMTAAFAAVKIISAALSTFGVGTLGSVIAAFGPVIAVMGAFALGFYAIREAYDRNLGGFGKRFDEILGQVQLSFNALTQLFSQGGFSGAVREEFLKSSNPAINFAIQVWLAFNRLKNFFTNVIDGFFDSVGKMGATFDELGKSFDKVLSAFGLFSNTTEENAAAFDHAGSSGQRIGAVLASIAEIVVKAVTAFLDLTAVVIPLVGNIVSLIDKLGGLETIVWLAKAALVAYATYMVASAVPAVLSFGGSLVSLVGNLPNAAAGLRSLISGAASGLGPIGALTLAVTALWLAFDQGSKLNKELGEHGWGDMWKKLKNDLGFTSDDEYQKSLGIVSGDDYDRQQSLRAREAQLSAVTTSAPIPNAAPSSINTPALAAMGPQQSIDTGAYEAAARNAAQAAVGKIQPPSYAITMVCDGQVLGQIAAKHQSTQAVDSFAPVSIQD